MNEESLNCAKCGATGWTEATPINEKAKKEIPCGACGYKNKYVKKKWKSAVIT